MTEPAFTWPVRVYYEDTDAGGVVYHAAYLRFLERARTEWLRALGFEQDALREQHDILFVARRLEIEFLRPARFNDLLRITATLTDHGGASFDFTQQVLAADADSRYCRATVNIVCLSATRMRPTRLPAIILAALNPPQPTGTAA